MDRQFAIDFAKWLRLVEWQDGTHEQLMIKRAYIKGDYEYLIDQFVIWRGLNEVEDIKAGIKPSTTLDEFLEKL